LLAGGVMMSDQEKFKRTIDELLNSPDLNFTAINQIVPNKKNLYVFFFSIIGGVAFAIKVGFDHNTIKLLLTTVGILFNMLLPIFGYLFTVYSILLAFLNDSYIEESAKIDCSDGSSFLKNSIAYYESVLYLYFIGVVITGGLFLFLSCVESDWVLTSNQLLNDYLAVLLLFIYSSFIFRIILELKSIICNTVVLFRTSIAHKLLKTLKNEQKGEK
jgi:hypothetical protein